MNHPVTIRLRELLHATPFAPFTIHLVNGKVFPVPHEDFLFIGRSGNVIFDDGAQIKNLNPTLITEIEEKTPSEA